MGEKARTLTAERFGERETGEARVAPRVPRLPWVLLVLVGARGIRGDLVDGQTSDGCS